MANPTLKVEIAFTSTPLATTPVWVDVSADVRQSPGVVIKRGGDGDPDDPDRAGRCTFTLANRTRKYDWTYATGPYHGYLTPKRQVRISATWAGSDYPLFYGWITAWPNVGRENGSDAVVEIEAYDAIGYLAGGRLNGDPLADYVDALTPICWLRNVDSTGIADTTGVYNARAGVSQPLKPGSVLSTLRSTAVVGDGIGWAELFPQPSSAGSWTISMWITSTAGTSTNSQLKFWGQVTTPQDAYLYAQINVTTGNFVFYNAISSGVTSTEVTGARDVLNDGVPHHVVLVSSSATSYTLYVDGLADAGATVAVLGAGAGTVGIETVAAVYGWTVSPVVRIPPTDQLTLASSSIQDLLFIDSGLTATQVQAIYNLSRGFATETTATRAGRLLDEADWPSAWRDISTATVGECGPIAFNGQATLTGLQQVERTEQGRMYAARDGKLTFRQRHYAYSDTVSNTVQATFSDDGANESYESFGHRRGDIDVVNDATVTTDQFEARSTDATSQTTYGTNANTYDTVLSTYAQTLSVARGVVFLRKDAATRLIPIKCGQPSNWVTVLSLELASRVRVESTPMGITPQLVADVLIDGIGWSISDQGWHQTISGNPIPPDPIEVGWWTLDVSKLGTGTALAY